MLLVAACLAACLPLQAQTFAVLSDINGRYGSTSYHDRVGRAVEVIEALGPALVISAGDMVAGQKQPQLDSQHLLQMWTAFDNTVAEPLLKAGIPFAITPGNHDGSGFPKFALEREQFESQWKGRHQGLELLSGSEWPLRYAAQLDSILLLAFDGTMPGKLPVSEFKFLQTMLEKHRSSFKAVVVVSHLPMWPLASGREKEILNDPTLLALLHRHEVSVFLSGHHHLFYAGRDTGGMIHLATGALGGNARPFSGSDRRQPHSFTLLKISDNSVRFEALAAPDFQTPVDTANLPRHIDGPLGRLERIETPDQFSFGNE